MEKIASALSLFCLSAHVTLVCTGDSRPYFLVAGSASAIAAFVYVLPRGPLIHYIRSGVVYYLACAVVAWLLDAFLIHCIAYVSAVLVLWWIDVAYARDLVNYIPTSSYFFITRSSFYALIRVLTHVAVRDVSFVPTQVESLGPVSLATVESIFMYFLKTTAYTFTVHSSTFVVYTLLKAAVFLAVPYLEMWIVDELVR